MILMIAMTVICWWAFTTRERGSYLRCKFVPLSKIPSPAELLSSGMGQYAHVVHQRQTSLISTQMVYFVVIVRIPLFPRKCKLLIVDDSGNG